MNESDQISPSLGPDVPPDGPDPVPSSPEPTPRAISSATVEGHDAVCFTAGAEAAVVGAGTIHAYLSARRTCPKVVAGISLGALNAAAMQRAYREISRSTGQSPRERESARWTWFRHYLDTVSDQPVSVLWNAIPDQSDFFADMIPIRDTSVPRHLREEEAASRRRQYLLVKVGWWLARLPVSVGLATGVVVNYVRSVEKYSAGQKALSVVGLLAQLFNLLMRLIVHVCLSPHFFPEHKFRLSPTEQMTAPLSYRCRIPLASTLNLITLTVCLTLVPIAVVALYLFLPFTELWSGAKVPMIVAVAGIGLVAATAGLRQRIMRWPIVQRIVFPALGLFASACSVVNLVIVPSLVFLLGRALYQHAFHPSDDLSVERLLAESLAVVGILINVLFVPLVLLPETRRWLVERRYVRELPRPLFGWELLLFLWAHLFALTAFLVLGASFIVRGLPHGEPQRAAELLVIGGLRLVSIHLLALIPAILPVIFWRHMKRLANARIGWRKAVALIASGLITLGLLALGICLARYRLEVFFRTLSELAQGSGTPKVNFWLDPTPLSRLFVLSALLSTLTWLVIFTIVSQPVFRRGLARWVLAKVGLQDSLIHDMYLRLKLLRLFDGGWPENKHNPEGPLQEIGDDPMPAVIVAASLQTLYERGQPKLAYQLWARPATPLLHALRAALASPPIFAPQRIKGAQLQWWLKESVRMDADNTGQLERGIDLVDGAVIRQNPLPALYSFLRGLPRGDELAANNDREHPAIHVVYGVPIEGRASPSQNGHAGTERERGGFRNTIVDVGLASLRLSQRRDTQLEVMQANTISHLESLIPATHIDWAQATHAIYADEIAPEKDLVFRNALDPERHEILAGIAAGCRRSLETLYRHDLAAAAPAHGASVATVACKVFLMSIGKLDSAFTGDVPGLPEICERCTGHLQIPPARPTQGSTASVERHLSEHTALSREHPQLSGSRPRIVFVASGGVFRGAFHIGMLAALHSCAIKPDLIVGASVGTLMGGALGAMFVHEDDVLSKLVDIFMRVDESVALTRTLKSAARELGIRGRAMRLSPRDVRRMLRRGARSDPGFAATGAPTALIDAIADLLMIPHRQTSRIAADFVAGQVASAANRLINQLRTETIRRLDIERAALGTSLLEDVIFNLLTDGTSAYRQQRQPFQRDEIAFYGTTTNLSTQTALLLGGHGLHSEAPYDFVEAALASSAFPGVFAPRAESAVFPGTGRADVYFADGGMFDNLPFLPAIEILSRAQRGYRSTIGAERTPLEFLQQRLAQPDLLIAGALDPVPEHADGARGSFTSLGEIRGRASSLQHNIKIRAFQLTSQRIYSQLLRLEAVAPGLPGPAAPLAEGIVNAAVLPVFPASADHLNGTFAFCSSAGLDRRRVQKSIADGCYQTLLKLATEQESARTAAPTDLAQSPRLLTAKSVQFLVGAGRIPSINLDMDLFTGRGICPYFTKDSRRFDCPFVRATTGDNDRAKMMEGVIAACRHDRMHHRARV